MSNSIKLRTLVSLTFVIFLLPFLRTCSDKTIEDYTFKEVPEKIVLDSINTLKNNPSFEKEILGFKKDREQKIIETKKESTVNLYNIWRNNNIRI